MLTRLKVSGFKNLVDLDVSFGPFTCIAGANGVGKSNLLDAILFLSALADTTLVEAALSVRDQGAKTGDIRGLFHRAGHDSDPEMSFVAEMIIPGTGADDLGQPAEASSTFVSYSVRLRYKQDEPSRALGSLELISEELRHISSGDASKHLQFEHSKSWRDRVVQNHRPAANYISTKTTDSGRFIQVHQDGGSSGKPQTLKASNLPRTVLSAANSAESPTATLAKREMQSWRLLQLEPTALREPDSFTAPTELASNGAHLPSTLYHLKTSQSDAVYCEIANQLSELLDDVRAVYVDRDERRQLLTAYVKGRDGTAYPARALSDGTLRFLALAVLALDSGSRGLICLEEPENGIHPERIPAIIRLLQELVTDVEATNFEDESKSLRQVIINTHSPSVVMLVPEGSLLMAGLVEDQRDGVPFRALQLQSLQGTWREKEGSPRTISKGRLLAYLNPVSLNDENETTKGAGTEVGASRGRRVVDREDLRQYKIPFAEIAG